MASQPFIVTAELPPDLFKWADALRRTHFPPERNWLQAHVTLFHSFAPSLRRELPALLARIAAEYAPPSARIDGLMDLGQGPALAIVSPAMLASVPAGRFAEAHEVAAAIAFLAAPAAGYANGVTLAVDGGRLQSI